MRTAELFGYTIRASGTKIVGVLLLCWYCLSPTTVFADDAVRFGFNDNLERTQTMNISLPLQHAWTTTVTSSGTFEEPPILGQAVILEDKKSIYQVAGRDLMELGLDGKILSRVSRVEQDSYPAVSSIYFNSNTSSAYFGNRKGGMNSFSTSGTRNWNVWHDTKTSSSPLELDGKIIYGSTEKVINVVDKYTGTIVKHLEVDGQVTSSASRIGEYAFIGIDQNRMKGYVAKIPMDSSKETEFLALSSGIPNSIANDGHYLYFSDKAGRLYRYDSDDLTPAWPTQWQENGHPVAYNTSYLADNTFSNNSPALYSDYAIFVLSRCGSSQNGMVVCVNANDGKTVWTKPLNSPSYISPIVWDTADLLLVADRTGIYGLDPATGQSKLWYAAPDGQLHAKYEAQVTSELSLGGGMLVFGTVDGKITALGKSKDNLAIFGVWQGAQKIEPNVQCAGAVRLGVSVGITENVQAPVVVRVNGNVVLQKEITFEAGPDKPKEQVLDFNYTVPNSEDLVIEASINGNHTAKYVSGQAFIERTYEDNYKKLELPILRDNLKVTSIACDSGNTVSTSETTKVRITVKNEGPETVTTEVRLYKGERKEGSKAVALASGQSKEVVFNWTAPAVPGRVSLKGILNPDHSMRERSYEDNEKTTTLTVEEVTDRHLSSKLEITPVADPTEVKAGQGFAVKVTTRIRDDDDHVGPSWVQARFANGETVQLQPTYGSRANYDVWHLPVDTRYGTDKRLHIVPETTPDGRYYVTITAGGAGSSRSITETKTIYVTIRGSMFDDLGTHIVN